MQIKANGGLRLFIFYFVLTLFLSTSDVIYFQSAMRHAVLMDLIRTSVIILLQPFLVIG